MKDILQWIPNFLKGMLEILERVQEMSGGKIRGHIIFWSALILFFVFAVAFLMNWSNDVWENFCSFLGHFKINITQVEFSIPSNFWVNMVLSLFLSIFYVIALIAIGGTIGAFIGTLTSIIFPGLTTYRLDKAFKELIPLLEKSHELNQTDDTKRILDDVNKLSERWEKRLSNRITRWLTTKTNRDKFDKMKL